MVSSQMEVSSWGEGYSTIMPECLPSLPSWASSQQQLILQIRDSPPAHKLWSALRHVSKAGATEQSSRQLQKPQPRL